MESDLEQSIKNLWLKKRLFHMERDKFKPRLYLNNGLIDVFNEKQDLSLYKGLLINDIYSRYYKMRGYNVFYSFGYNNISKVSFFKKNPLNLKEKEELNTLENNIHSLGLSNDPKKELKTDSNTFVEFSQKFFSYLFSEELIKIEKRFVYVNETTSKTYNTFEVNNIKGLYYLKSNGKKVSEEIREVVILDFKKFAPKVIKEINELNYPINVKNKLKSVLIPNYGLEIKLTNTFKDLYFKINMEHPEFIGGIDYISMNPDLMDVTTFIGEEEKSIVESYIAGEDKLGVYSGNFFINPLTGRSIPIIISKKYDKSYYLGISSLYKNDNLFCGLLHLDNINIIEEDKLINSDFLSGLDKKEAHNEIIEVFSKEEFACKTYSFLNTEIIISSEEDYGLLIPLFSTDSDYKITPNEYLPFFLGSRVSLALQSKENYSQSLNVINKVFNEYYIIGLASIVKRLLANEMEIPDFNDSSFPEIYNEYSDTKHLVVKENYLIHEILMPIIFRLIIKEKYPNIKEDSINNTKIFFNRDKYDDEIDFNLIKKDYSTDSFRMYMAITPNDSLETINYAKLEYCKKFTEKVEFLFDEASNIDYYKNDFYEISTKLVKYLKDENITAYTRVLTDYVSTLFNEKINYKFGLNILKLLYLIIPCTVEHIYLEKYKSKHFLIYDEWTL